MKAGRTIEAMLQELARQNAAKEDYLVNTSFLIMEADGSGAALHMAGREEVRPLPWGFGLQRISRLEPTWVSRLNTMAKFLRKTPSAGL